MIAIPEKVKKEYPTRVARIYVGESLVRTIEFKGPTYSDSANPYGFRLGVGGLGSDETEDIIVSGKNVSVIIEPKKG